MINRIVIKINKRIVFLFLLVINIQLFAQDQNITIDRTVNTDKSIDLSYSKKLPGSYYLFLEFSNLSNCDTKEFKNTITGFSGYLLKLKPNDPQQGIGYSFKFNSVLGVPNPKVDSLFQYTLPFKIGKKVTIYEAGNIGEKYFGAEKPAHWKSYVVNLKSSDTIFSMRKGMIVKLTNDYDDDDASIAKHYTSKRNSITIEHEDGTFAEYAGFKKDSFKVKLGQIVYPQTQLGIVELFDKKENNYRFDFNIYYLANLKNIGSNEKQTLKNYESKYNFITPHFLTSEGFVVVESNKEYSVLFNETILFQEMTRSEKKKYIKDPSQFK
jgi:hypothetical protein